MPQPHRVVALALPDVILLDLAAPTHLFGHCGGRRYRFELAGVRAGRVSTSTGLEIIAPRGLQALEDAETIVVPGSEDVAPTAGFRRAAAAVARAQRRGARVISGRSRTWATRCRSRRSPRARPCPHGRSPDASAPRRARRPRNGCSSNGCAPPRRSSRRPSSPSSRSPDAAGSATRPRFAPISRVG